ncbi:PLP-dependent aminotransferase family protein [Endozoicomonas lisbonensis]|uniref:GntR family transcriptional regulator/MocR family aminotransferase n=2 Tax=Endozoicomonas lisbonensis TaxID=3120522 RepID=A0ABV2SJ39_9GAMM
MRMPLVEMPELKLDSDCGTPLFDQLYQTIRQRVLNRLLSPGTRLPSSRNLARQLGIARNTVIAAYEQLIAEGYLESKSGSGTFVTEELPEAWFQADTQPSSARQPLQTIELSNYADVIKGENIREMGSNQGFTVGIPDLKAFPAKLWNKVSNSIPQAGLTELMGFQYPQGLPELQEAITDYVRSSRAVRCEPDHVVITQGAQQALDLCARLFLNPGDPVAMENPGYIGAQRAINATGAHIIPLPVDEQGVVVSALEQLHPPPKLVYVTPAHHYPLGNVMSLQRRTQLLNWATTHNSWILEDDYDSEYHYQNRPLASLQGLCENSRVIYIGSFSKVLFPALRLGYTILPPSLTDVFTKAKMEHSGETPVHIQATTAAFIQQGYFSNHLKRMRVLYARKLDTMLNACELLKPWCKVHAQGAGMHLVLEFIADICEESIVSQLLKKRIYCSRLSQYYLGKPEKYGLALGFANSSESEIKHKVEQIALIIQEYKQP